MQYKLLKQNSYSIRFKKEKKNKTKGDNNKWAADEDMSKGGNKRKGGEDLFGTLGEHLF